MSAGRPANVAAMLQTFAFASHSNGCSIINSLGNLQGNIAVKMILIIQADEETTNVCNGEGSEECADDALLRNGVLGEAVPRGAEDERRDQPEEEVACVQRVILNMLGSHGDK